MIVTVSPGLKALGTTRAAVPVDELPTVTPEGMVSVTSVFPATYSGLGAALL
jgi:hypothetical protein